MLILESSGGTNVWGRDQVDTGGIYTKGAPVDEQTYLRYREARRAGRIKTQGCGPAQITFHTYQDRADELGGCWRPEVNCRVGFGILAGHLRRGNSFRDAFSRYNTGGPGPSPYATKAMALLSAWERLIEQAGTDPALT